MNTMSKFEQYLAEAQQYKSAGTSINKEKLPATFSKLAKMGVVTPGMIVADIGGGKFDNAIEWAKERDASLHVVDPYNRSLEYNKKSLEEVRGKADIATINNVLNVINEPHQRHKVILRAYRVLKEGGHLYVLIYEGDKSGEGRETQKGQSWQNNRATKDYVDEVKRIFGEATVKNGMIMATK
jgi:ubiquinone/menaquinone biosynthesis C-methylase UbiE